MGIIEDHYYYCSFGDYSHLPDLVIILTFSVILWCAQNLWLLSDDSAFRHSWIWILSVFSLFGFLHCLYQLASHGLLLRCSSLLHLLICPPGSRKLHFLVFQSHFQKVLQGIFAFKISMLWFFNLSQFPIRHMSVDKGSWCWLYMEERWWDKLFKWPV